MSRRELVEELYWDSPGDMFAFTTGAGFPPHMFVPPDITSFAGTEIDAAVCACMMLRDKSGKVVGIGSELEVRPSPGEEGARVDVYFTIMLPGRGTLFFQTLKKNEDLTSNAKGGEWTFEPTVGPGKDGKSVMLCGTGEFEGVQGSHFQKVHIHHINPDSPTGDTHKVRCVETFHFNLPQR